MSEPNQISNEPQNNMVTATARCQNILETAYAGLRVLFRDFPVGFNNNDEFKAELGVDSVRRELRFIGMILVIPWAVSLLMALKLKLVPILIAAALSFLLYRVLNALVRCSHESLLPADKTRVQEFLGQVTTAQYQQPNQEISKQLKKDLQDYKAALDGDFTYGSLDRLVTILNRTLERKADMFRCAFNVSFAHKEAGEKISLVKRLIEVLK